MTKNNQRISAQTTLKILSEFISQRGDVPPLFLPHAPIRNSFGEITVLEIDSAIEEDRMDGIDDLILDDETPILDTRDLLVAGGLAEYSPDSPHNGVKAILPSSVTAAELLGEKRNPTKADVTLPKPEAQTPASTASPFRKAFNRRLQATSYLRGIPSAAWYFKANGPNR